MTEKDLAECLNPTLTLLGMNLTRATRTNDEYRLEMQAVPETVTLTIDIESLRFHAQPYAAAQLITRELEDAQLRLHDAIRKAIDKRDVRQRIVLLDNREKAALHDLVQLAYKGVSTGPMREQERKDLTAGLNVLERLFR